MLLSESDQSIHASNTIYAGDVTLSPGVGQVSAPYGYSYFPLRTLFVRKGSLSPVA